MPELTPTAVKAILLDCFFKPEEIPDPTKAPPGAVLVQGIANSFGLHPERLESHRDEVKALVAELPEKFKDGASFAEMCEDRNGRQWTDFHRDMEALVVLGLGLKLMMLPFDNPLTWGVLPGGLPYVKVL